MIQITGISSVASRLSVTGADVLSHLHTGLSGAADRVITESVKRTPVDTGELRERAFVDEPVVSADTMGINLGYEKHGTGFPVTSQGSPEEYAVLVHERTDIYHKVGQAKFLESSLNDFGSEYLDYLGEAVKEVFQR